MIRALNQASSLGALLLVMLWAAPASALELSDVEGAYRLEGTDTSRRDFTVFLSLRQVGQTWRLERSARFLGKERDEPATVWTATSIRLSTTRLRATFVEGARGMSDALAQLGRKKRVYDVTYTFSAGSVTELVRPKSKKAKWRASSARGDLATPALKLVSEVTFESLLGDEIDHYEASGITRRGRRLFVVFDNDRRIAEVDARLSKGTLHKTRGKGSSNFEGLTYDPVLHRFYALVEAEFRRDMGKPYGRVWELDSDFKRLDRAWLKVELPTDNRGFEGTLLVRRGGERYLLALLEGNRGKSGAKGERRGKGRIEVFKGEGEDWKHKATIDIPKTAFFVDYSGIALRGQQVAIVSQTSSALWVGELESAAWKFKGEGKAYRFPRTHSRIQYPSIEGVEWLSNTRLTVVSDAHRDAAQGKAESIHVFDLPK